MCIIQVILRIHGPEKNPLLGHKRIAASLHVTEGGGGGGGGGESNFLRGKHVHNVGPAYARYLKGMRGLCLES